MTSRRSALLRAALLAAGIGLPTHGCNSSTASPGERCAAGTERCGDDCVDLTTDPGHCGACGEACGAQERCFEGTCVLDCGEQTACLLACVDLASDPEHCGGCSRACDRGDACVGGVCSGPGDPIWESRYGDDAFQDGWDVAYDGAGNLLLTGAFVGTIDFGGGPLTAPYGGIVDSDVFVAKLGPNREHLWSRRYGDEHDQTAFAIASGPQEEVVVAGWFSGVTDFGLGPVTAQGQDAFVLKLDAGGETSWLRSFGSGFSLQARDVVVAPDGGVVFVGTARGEVDFGLGPTSGGSGDLAVVALDADGSTVWAQRFVGTDGVVPHGMARDSEGNVLVIGGYHGDVQVGGEVLTSPGGWDDDNMFLIKLDPNGQPLWSRRFGDEGPMQVGRAVACDGNDDIIIAGGVSGTADFGGGTLTASTFLDYDAFVAKLDPQGNHRWSYLVGNGGQMIYTMAAHPDGTIAIAGSSEGRMSWPSGELVSRGPFVAKLDTDGALRWAKGDPDGAGLAAGVAIGASGVVAATGSFSKTLTLGEDPMVCAGRSDVFVVELTP